MPDVFFVFSAFLQSYLIFAYYLPVEFLWESFTKSLSVLKSWKIHIVSSGSYTKQAIVAVLSAKPFCWLIFKLSANHRSVTAKVAFVSYLNIYFGQVQFSTVFFLQKLVLLLVPSHSIFRGIVSCNWYICICCLGLKLETLGS